MEYLGFDVGYGWWKPAASKMQPLQDMHIRDDPRKGLHDVRNFIGACNFYRHHIHNFAYSSAPLTDLIKKNNPWRCNDKEDACFQELKKKIASTNCLGVPRPKVEIILVTDAYDVGGVGTLYQWQELNPAELSHCQFQTSGLNCDRTRSITTLPVNGVWYLLVTHTGSGIKHDPTTVPTTRNSSLGCSCFLPSPVYLVQTLLSGFVTKSRWKCFRRVPLLKKRN